MARARKPHSLHLDFAWGLVFTPTILLFPLVWGALNDPSAILEYWDLYLLFFGIPYAVAIAIFYHVRRARRDA